MEKGDPGLVPIHITVTKFWEKAVGKVVIFYQNVIQMGKQIWEVEKRFSQYDDLHLMLSKKYANLPKLPQKGFFKLNAEGWEQRRKDLQVYVRDLVKRSDLRTDPFFRDFFELDLHNSNTMCYSPIKITQLDELPLGIRDFHYLNDKGLLFFALSEMKITSRLDSYLTNLNLPWEKKKDDTYSTVGALIFYRVGLRESNGEWVFTRLWAKNFAVQTNILWWSPDKEMIFMGMDDGVIYGFSIVNKGISLSQEVEIKAHSKRVMGLAYDSENHHIISISEDGKFKWSDISTEEPVHEETIGKGGLKSLVHDKFYKRMFIGDGYGSIHIMSYVNYPPELIGSISAEKPSWIRGMCIDNDLKFLYTGDVNGYINWFDLGPIGKERFAKQVGEIKGVSKIRYMVWTNENREIFAGNESGKLNIWDPEKGKWMFVHEAHERPITKMQWFEKSRYLMTASKDKILNVWQIPKQWINEEVPEGEIDDEEAKFRTKKLKKIMEEQKFEEEPEEYCGNEVEQVEADDGFQNISQGFDPLGGGMVKTKKVNQDDDDLLGWNQ